MKHWNLPAKGLIIIISSTILNLIELALEIKEPDGAVVLKKEILILIIGC